MNDEENLITLRQAAKFLGISYQAVNQAVERGTLQHQMKKILVSFKGILKEKMVKHTTVRWIYDFQDNKRDIKRLKIYGKPIFDHEDGIYTVDDVSKMLNMTKRKIHYWISVGELKTRRKGVYHMIMKEDIERFLRRAEEKCKSA